MFHKELRSPQSQRVLLETHTGAKDAFWRLLQGHLKNVIRFLKSYQNYYIHAPDSQRRSMRLVCLSLYNKHRKPSVSMSRMHTRLLAFGITLHVLATLQCVSARVVPTRSVAFNPFVSPFNALHSGIAIPRNPQLLVSCPSACVCAFAFIRMPLCGVQGARAQSQRQQARRAREARPHRCDARAPRARAPRRAPRPA